LLEPPPQPATRSAAPSTHAPAGIRERSEYTRERANERTL
jgi:hypothetical protein